MSKIRFSPKENKQERATRNMINQQVLNNIAMRQEAISIEEEQFYRNNPSGGMNTCPNMVKINAIKENHSASIHVNNKRLMGEAINELTKGEEVLVHYIVNEEEYSLIINETTQLGVLTGLMENTQIKYIARDILGKLLIINSQPPQ
jgi:hypothetical protein